MYLCLMLAFTNGSLVYINIFSFLPQYIAENHKDVKSVYVGLAFSLHPLFFLLTGVLLGHYLKRIGRKNVLLLGELMLIISTAAYIGITYI